MKCDEVFGDGGGGDTGGVCVESVGGVVWVEGEADEYSLPPHSPLLHPPLLPLPQTKTPTSYPMLFQQQHNRHRHGKNQTRNLRTKTKQSLCPLGPRQQTTTRTTLQRRPISQIPRRTLRRRHRHLRLRQPPRFHSSSSMGSQPTP